MIDLQKYISMQLRFYDRETSGWSLQNKDPVVGQYEAHNAWSDYDNYLFKDFDTSTLIALDYGCGPGRNIVKFNKRFAKIDGVDLHPRNVENARLNTRTNNITNSEFFLCNGMSIPRPDESYDVIFSTICLQHICVYDIRFNIFKDAYRVLKPNGYICIQMGFGGKQPNEFTAGYYENFVDAASTNAACDTRIDSEEQVRSDLEDKIGFKNFKFDLRPTGPGDSHKQWIFFQAQK